MTLDLHLYDDSLACPCGWSIQHRDHAVHMTALLAHVRALTAVLQPFCDPSRAAVPAEAVLIAERRMIRVYVTPREHAAATAVLAATGDAP